MGELQDVLAAAWLRRQRFTARLQAQATVAALAEALGQGAGGRGQGSARVSADELLREMGASL